MVKRERIMRKYIVMSTLSVLSHTVVVAEGGYFTTDYKTPEQRALRDKIGPYIGKVLFVNDIDKDGNGTPDFMDGWGCTTTQIPRLEHENPNGNHRAINTQNRFVPFSVSLEKPPPTIATDNLRFRFDYPESPPETLRLVTKTWNVGFGKDMMSDKSFSEVVSSVGYIRIWKKDGMEARSVATDYVRSNQTVMSYAELQNLDNPGTLYLEAVNACTNWSGVRIVVSMSLDNGNTWVMSNAVRVTSMRCNFTVGVVRPFYKDASKTRRLFAPDHTTPSSSLADTMDAYVETLKNNGAGGGDRWWHDGDAILGHGFAYFQYEGPDLDFDDNDPSHLSLYKICCNTQTGRDHDGKYYFGKTGGGSLSFWDSCPGVRNIQATLAWWDICPYKIEGKPLVLKKTYTLHPQRMSALFDAFHDNGKTNKYVNFGLHIIPAPVNSWGCLSHVGLAMNAQQLDVATVNGCVFDEIVPSTANRSVWRVINGRIAGEIQDWLNNHPGETLPTALEKTARAQYDIAREAISILRQANAAVLWEQTVDTTSPAFVTMVNRLFTLCNGKPLLRADGTMITVQSVEDLNLDNVTESLHFYDPGYFPSKFGELPESVFDVRP